jgi:hypothetical protein
MQQLNPLSEPTQVTSFDAHDFFVSFSLAIVIVAAMWVTVVLWFSSPSNLPKPIERPLQIGTSTHSHNP